MNISSQWSRELSWSSFSRPEVVTLSSSCKAVTPARGSLSSYVPVNNVQLSQQCMSYMSITHLVPRHQLPVTMQQLTHSPDQLVQQWKLVRNEPMSLRACLCHCQCNLSMHCLKLFSVVLRSVIGPNENNSALMYSETYSKGELNCFCSPACQSKFVLPRFVLLTRRVEQQCFYWFSHFD